MYSAWLVSAERGGELVFRRRMEGLTAIPKTLGAEWQVMTIVKCLRLVQ